MSKERIVSGIQPSGEMHIGNYLGALKDFVELQDKPARPDDSGRSGGYECFFFIADLHSISENYDPKTKRQQILETLAAFVSVGIDPNKSTIFVQSQIPAHSELAWIFSTITPINELQRMTQFKDKSLKQKTNINAGLLTYPILQAADILLYHPGRVPVGEDQIQHLEMTNVIARKFNNKFGEYFKEVKPYMKKPVRIMSLSDPTKKMSKSDPSSYVGIFDEPEVIKKKLSKAVTATDAKQDSPGVANLFLLLEHFGSKEHATYFSHEQKNNTIKYSELKETLATAIADHFAPFRAKRAELMQNPDQITEILFEGAKKATTIAETTINEVKKKIGLI